MPTLKTRNTYLFDAYTELRAEFLGFMGRTSELLKDDNYNSLGKMPISEKGHYDIQLYGYRIFTEFLPLYDTDEDDVPSGALAVLFYTHHLEKPLEIMVLHLGLNNQIYINDKEVKISMRKSDYEPRHSEYFMLQLNDIFVRKLNELVISPMLKRQKNDD